MKFVPLSWLLMLSATFGRAADLASSTNSDAVLRETLFQRFLDEMHKADQYTKIHWDQSATNSARVVFNTCLVDPTFGLLWDEVPAPTLIGSNALAEVEAFIKTNGWNMATNNDIFGEMSDSANHPMKPIRGLPWKAVKDREFMAVTHNGVLYVMLSGWHHNLNGVAYNPHTNLFAPRIAGFKPIGHHWYVWASPEDPVALAQVYEGKKP